MKEIKQINYGCSHHMPSFDIKKERKKQEVPSFEDLAENGGCPRANPPWITGDVPRLMFGGILHGDQAIRSRMSRFEGCN